MYTYLLIIGMKDNGYDDHLGLTGQDELLAGDRQEVADHRAADAVGWRVEDHFCGSHESTNSRQLILFVFFVKFVEKNTIFSLPIKHNILQFRCDQCFSSC